MVAEIVRGSVLVAFCALGAAQGLKPQTPVILISVDTLRADHLDVFGYRRVPTPNFDSFAEGGTLFLEADAQIPLTLPSHTSLFTSTFPFENRIEENAERVPSGVPTLAGVLRPHGYKTAAFIGSVFLERQMGLDQGFEDYDSPFHFEAFSPLSGSMFFGGLTRGPNAGRDRRDGALVVRAAEQWLAAHRGEPVFAFVHLYDLHKPYRRGSYDAEVAYTDRVLGTFRRFLEQSGWWERSLVVLLSDHGEGLGEHGESSHGYFIYESTLHVPLVFHWPAGTTGYPARVSQPAGLIDVAPTILECLHIQAPASFEGVNALGPPHAIYAETVHTHDSFGWAPLRSLRLGDYKYIEAPRAELYRLSTDPGERLNLAAQKASDARKLRGELAQLMARHTAAKGTEPASDVSPQTRALLGSLGYLARGPRTKIAGPQPDPKDRLAEYQLYEKAMTEVYDGHLAQAVATLRSVLAQDPQNTLARRDLGACYLELRDDAKARSAFEKVLEAAPDDYMGQYELGVADEHLGLLQESLKHLETACGIAPDATQCRTELEVVRQKMK
ncbi:MAG TPA: sulfatase-like hydrolase/transferase [Bryobacteraceae bacterium]|nr:sulfatase-like hydrolase/transferase [Bryobacteraceae bacterium]